MLNHRWIHAVLNSHAAATARRAAAVSLLSALALAAGTTAAAAQTSGDPQRVVLLGDSITEGIMSGPPGGVPYADLLATGLSATHEFVNIGCGGTSSPMWTISQGTTLCMGANPATIFETFAIPNLPADFVAIMLGTNDSVGFFLPDRVTGAEYATHMLEIIGNSLFFGARTIVLMSPPPKCGSGAAASTPFLEDYRVVAHNICTQHPDVICGPDIYTLLDSGDFDNCGVHPNQRGHNKIAMGLGTSLVQHAPLSPEIEVFGWFEPDVPGAASVLPVVVYSDDGFDAIAQTDTSQFTFGATGWEESRVTLPGSGADACFPVDVDDDGRDDLVCAFDLDATDLTLQSGGAWLRGRSNLGAAIDSAFVGTADDLVEFPPELIPDLRPLF